MNFKEISHVARKIAKLGRYFHSRGWSMATSSNYSYRLGEGRVLITSSGVQKDELSTQDFMIIDYSGKPIDEFEDRRPSAETLLHCEIYKSFSKINCVLHTHSIYSSLLGNLLQNKGKLTLENYEMLKALSDVKTHEHIEEIPIYKNSQDMKEIISLFHEDVSTNPALHAYVIAGHGLYTWSDTIENTKKQVEALEFLLECHYREMLIKNNNIS